MPFPFVFVSHARYMLMVQAANQAAIEREHERTERRRAEQRFDDLFTEYRALRREGFVVPASVSVDDREAATVSVDDADRIAASKQPVEVAD